VGGSEREKVALYGGRKTRRIIASNDPAHRPANIKSRNLTGAADSRRGPAALFMLLFVERGRELHPRSDHHSRPVTRQLSIKINIGPAV